MTRPMQEAIALQQRNRLAQYAATRTSSRLGWVGAVGQEFRRQPPSRIDLPSCNHHLLTVQLSASGQYAAARAGGIYEGRSFLGELEIAPAGRPASWCWTAPMDFLHLQLSPALMAGAAVEALDAQPDRIELLNHFSFCDAYISYLALSLLAELQTGGLCGPLFAEAQINRLAVHLVRYYSNRDGLAPRPRGWLSRQQLLAVVNYVEEHLEGPIKLADLAFVVRVSVFHFARLYKASTGLSPHQYVIGRRVERAKLLLRDTERTLAQIAAYVGFADQAHFTRHFKQRVGVTPGQYRTA